MWTFKNNQGEVFTTSVSRETIFMEYVNPFPAINSDFKTVTIGISEVDWSTFEKKKFEEESAG